MTSCSGEWVSLFLPRCGAIQKVGALVLAFRALMGVANAGSDQKRWCMALQRRIGFTKPYFLISSVCTSTISPCLYDVEWVESRIISVSIFKWVLTKCSFVGCLTFDYNCFKMQNCWCYCVLVNSHLMIWLNNVAWSQIATIDDFLRKTMNKIVSLWHYFHYKKL